AYIPVRIQHRGNQTKMMQSCMEPDPVERLGASNHLYLNSSLFQQCCRLESALPSADDHDPLSRKLPQIVVLACMRSQRGRNTNKLFGPGGERADSACYHHTPRSEFLAVLHDQLKSAVVHLDGSYPALVEIGHSTALIPATVIHKAFKGKGLRCALVVLA